MNIRRPYFCSRRSGFTMVEIAISLAIIGIALIAIVGVLPQGMNVQKENREATIVNQDATVFIEAIRNGARGMNDLTNYVVVITNFQTAYTPNPGSVNPIGYNNPCLTGINNAYSILTNGANIIGLLSTPEFTDLAGNPTNNLFSGGYSNHIVAYVRSISGPAVEKPPQDNPIIQSDSFSYRLFCVNAPVAMDTNSMSTPYNQQLAANLHELRLTFLWPLLPNGDTGNGRQTYRALVPGQVLFATNIVAGNNLYFYQPQSFVNAP